ncbi:hypothetical protein GCM10009668_36730 [Nocardioides dubius]|uniref:Uncharacterized protein n=1 Tax=Nocardioides dubius TaxID=317019 RepID=A0ABP4EJB7_9ACTN
MLVVVVGLGAVTAYQYLAGDDAGPPHPEAWDSRVAPYAEQVEKLRGLDFKQPVYVDFLSTKEFKAKVEVDDEGLDEEERTEIEQYEGMLRALGLIDAKVDIVKAMSDNSTGGTLAYYDPEDERIRMRGRELTPASTATLVHELTHALQDQHFDLESKLDDDDATQASMHRAVAEGDASRIEHLWVNDLPAKKRAAVEKAQQRTYEQGMKELAGVPAFVQAVAGAPYALGEPLSTLATAAEGLKGANDLFDDAPTNDEHLLKPLSWLNDKEKAKKVPEVELAKGESAIEDADGEFGALGWLFTLAERVPVLTALDAADAWGGDHYRSYTSKGRVCVRAHFTGDDASGTALMKSALTTWVARAPRGTASLTQVEDHLVFTSCDPEKATTRSSEASLDALTLAATRSTLAAQGAEAPGMSDTIAWCFADNVVHRLSIEQLTSDELPPGFEETMTEIAMDCRAS